MKTQVAIIGAGPSGLLLSQILHLNGIESVVLERQSREHVMGRVRAGVLEQGTVELLRRAGVGARMDQEGLIHEGIGIAFENALHRVDFAELTGGASVMVYGQTEITRDLFEARDAAGGIILDRAEDVMPHDVDSDTPYVTYFRDGEDRRIDCSFIAGCDGYHGVSRTVLPSSLMKVFERVYPIGWMGALSQTPPVAEEVTYTSHELGFALCSMRSRNLSRYYVQCPLSDTVDDWPDDRFWDELNRRIPEELSARLVTGPTVEKSFAPLRSFVVEPMRHGRLFLAGDAAHIVPPTGAKGLNLAAGDIHYLSEALIAHCKKGDDRGIASYSETALRRVWKAERFSWWMTMLLHQLDEEGPFFGGIQQAERDYLVNSRAAMTALAENYVGLPFA